ncbi:MAG: cation:dicarboxylase symporter family transporter [Acetobacteraceae bacterium]
MPTTAEQDLHMPRAVTPFHRRPSVQIGVAILLGIALGFAAPSIAVPMKVLGDIFLRLIKTIVAPLVFLNVVLGIVSAGDLKRVGKIGLRSLIYFEVVSTIALCISLAVANISNVGVGLRGSAPTAIEGGAGLARTAHLSFSDFLLNVFPDNFIGAFANGALLQVLVISVLFGAAVLALPPAQRAAIETGLDGLAGIFTRFTNLVMAFAPLGAFGSIAFVIGSNGMSAILSLGYLLAVLYLMLLFFVVVVLGLIARLYGFNLFPFFRYLRAEIILLFATGSSESAFPSLLEKLQRLGCSKQSVSVVLPTGYAFNLDGTAIYMSLCTLFLANAYGIHLGLEQQIGLVALMLFTSKGAATVSGGTFIVFAATVTASGILPVAGLPLLFGINRLTSQAVSICNSLGNAVATLIVAKSSGEFDPAVMQAEYERAFAAED